MKIFWPIFLAIVAAAIVICAVRGIVDSFAWLHRTQARTEWARQKADSMKRYNEFLQDQIRSMDLTAPKDAPGKK
jgi:hypothetical protein